MMKFRNFLSASLATLISIGLTGNAFSGDSVADFYKGKRLTIIVGSGPGGGYDTYSRLVGRHMGRHIPGKPTFIVQNKTGAGSIIATNFMVNIAPKDGTIVGGVQRSIALVQLLGAKGPKFKSAELNWLGSLAKEAGVCAIATRTGVKSFDDIFKKQFTMGGAGKNSTEWWPAN